MTESRRLRLYFLDQQYFKSIFNSRFIKAATCFECFIGGEEIPSTAKVLDIHYAVERRGLVAVVEHSSFDPVPAGERIPYSNEQFEIALIQVEQSDREKELRVLLDEKNAEIHELNELVERLTDASLDESH